MAEIPGKGHEGAAEKNQEEAEARYGQEREEQYAKRDRVLSRLMGAETVQDVASALEVIKAYEDVHSGETIDRYTFSAFKRAAKEGQLAFEKTNTQLISEGIVKGEIGPDGFLREGGRVRHGGWAIRVDRDIALTKKIVPKQSYELLPNGDKTNLKMWEETEEIRTPVEKVYFGTDAERRALARAHEELHRQLVTAEELQNQVITFDKTRAALEAMVDQFYKYQIYFTNKQTKWFFSAADIGEITPEQPENENLGKRRSKAIRLYYLIGLCETKEKMEKHLNETFNLEEILDKKTIDRTLDIAKDMNRLSGNPQTDDEKFAAAAKFLIGPNLELTKRKGEGWTYKLNKWLTLDKRNPNNDGRGKNAIGDEQDERGFLTDLGNPYAEMSRDNLYMLMSKMTMLVGDETAVSDAGRYFWTRGGRDELALELYMNEKDFPTGEALLDYRNSHSFEEWQAYCEKLQKCVTLEGEPSASDLSKLIHTKWWRFKEMIRDRSAGPLLTWDKFDNMTLSLFSLCRTKVDTGAVDSKNKPIKEFRSIREQLFGYKSIGGEADEKAKDLGKIEWEQVRISGEVKQALAEGGANIQTKTAGEKVFVPDDAALNDNADNYFWAMNWVAGEEKVDKRPYQFIMKGVERAGDLQRPEAYTDKIKFWKINWHGPVITKGDWRARYAKNKRLGEAYIKVTEDEADKEALDKVSKGKKDWYMGLRSLPDYLSWAGQSIDYLDDNGNSKQIKLGEYVEKMAILYGFLDRGEERRAIRAMKRMRVV
jgi:hypothetical protein